MTKLIKVTLEDCNVEIWIPSNAITKIMRKDGGSDIYTVDNFYRVKESPEQVEEQFLRDEFAKVALGGILANSSIDSLEAKDVSHDSFIFADAMLKERTK